MNKLTSAFFDFIFISVAACQSYENRCNDRVTCVDQRRWCDGNRDCPDGSDEVHCSTFTYFDIIFLSKSIFLTFQLN